MRNTIGVIGVTGTRSWTICEPRHQLPTLSIPSSPPPCKPPASNFNRQVPGLPSVLLTPEDEGLIFLQLSLTCLLHPLFPGYFELDKYNLLGAFRTKDNIMYKACGGYFLWEFELLLQVAPHLPVACCSRIPFDVISPTMWYWMKKGPFERLFTFFLACSIPAANWARIRLCLVMSPQEFPIRQTWLARGKDMLKLNGLSAECVAGPLCQPPCVEVWWSRQDIIHRTQ